MLNVINNQENANLVQQYTFITAGVKYKMGKFQMLANMWSNEKCSCTGGGSENCYNLLENSTTRSKLKIYRSFDQAIYLYILEKFLHTYTRSTLLKNIYSINI